ncbi:MT-A70-domain-containing protein [Chytriomyces sp. MP71]|nr:MT-A70-domain-containing protein [Chytriomyces sp. MP71]
MNTTAPPPSESPQTLVQVLKARQQHRARSRMERNQSETSDDNLILTTSDHANCDTIAALDPLTLHHSATENPSWIQWDPAGDDLHRPPPMQQHHNKSNLKNILKSDHCEHFVLSSKRPQNFVRDSDPITRFAEYPKLDALFAKKRDLVRACATPARWIKTDLWNFDLRRIGAQFDVILIDPPLAEYAHRNMETFNSEFKQAPLGCSPDLKRVWSWDDIASLNIQDIAAPRSFIFIWIGDGDGLEFGRDLLAKWGYRRAEDIVWAKTNKETEGSYHVGPFPVLQRQKEHCLVGIKGTLRRSSDTHFIHCNVDTDILISEEPPHGSTAKPAELYTVIENFCLGKRRLELFGREGNKRDGWLTVGAELESSFYNQEEYQAWFRNAPLVPFNQDIETLRPKSPPPKFNRRF